jgi:hypothetical protein
MRDGPAKTTRHPLPKQAKGDDEHRAGIRALDCGEEEEGRRVIRRAASPSLTDVPEPRSVPPGEQRQSV